MSSQSRVEDRKDGARTEVGDVVTVRRLPKASVFACPRPSGPHSGQLCPARRQLETERP